MLKNTHFWAKRKKEFRTRITRSIALDVNVLEFLNQQGTLQPFASRLARRLSPASHSFILSEFAKGR